MQIKDWMALLSPLYIDIVKPNTHYWRNPTVELSCVSSVDAPVAVVT